MITYDVEYVPVITLSIDTEETEVLVSVYDRTTGAAIPLDSNTAVQSPADSGRWRWTFNPTTYPITGNTRYSCKFTGTVYEDERWFEFNLVENIERYNGVVYLDINDGVPLSAALPYIGSLNVPVKNLADAITIAERIKSNIIYVKGALTLDRSIASYVIRGYSANFTDTITLANYSIADCRFEGLTLTGAWNGVAYCSSCQILDVTDFNGNLSNSLIMNSISIKDGGIFQADATAFLNYTTGVCVVDMQNSSTGVFAVGASNGIIALKNLRGGVFSANGTFIVTVDSSVVAGQFFFAGIGNVDGVPGVPLTWIGEYTKAYFNPAPPYNLILLWVDIGVPGSVQDTLLSEHTDAGTTGNSLQTIENNIDNLTTSTGHISEVVDTIDANTKKLLYGDGVWLSTTYGSAGAVVGVNGLFTNPVDSIEDALLLLTALNLKRINILDSDTYSLSEDVDGLSIYGINSGELCEIEPEEHDVRLILHDCSYTGISKATGNLNIFHRCKIYDSTLGFVEAYDSILGGTLLFYNGKESSFINCFSYYVNDNDLVLDLDGVSNANIQFMNFVGNLTITNCTSIGAVINFNGTGEMVIDSSCTFGLIIISGDMRVINNSAGVTVIYKQIMRDANGYVFTSTGIIEDKIDALITSTGHISTTVDNISSGGSINPQDIRDAMYLAPSTGSPAVASIDSKLNEILAAEGAGGSATVTITIIDGDEIPIQDAYVEIWNSGLTAIVTYGITDSNGQMQKTADDDTYKIKVRKGGYTFNDPFDLIVSGDTSAEYEGVTYIIDPASDVDLCRLYGYIVNGKKEAIEGITVSAVPYDSPTLIEATNSVVSPESVDEITTSTGEFTIDLIRNVKYTISISEIGFRKTILVPNSAGPVILWSLTDVFISSDPSGGNPNW